MSLPKKLLSDVTGELFENCSVCEKKLDNQLYFVEKAYHRNLGDSHHTAIFEYAICESCKHDMMKKVSQESMLKMQDFMRQHQEEMEEMLQVKNDLEHCSFTQQPIEELDEYHVIGVIKDGETQISPMVFGPKILESYQELLSEETKDFFDDFNNNFIDIPPELKKIFDKDIKPVLF